MLFISEEIILRVFLIQKKTIKRFTCRLIIFITISRHLLMGTGVVVTFCSVLYVRFFHFLGSLIFTSNKTVADRAFLVNQTLKHLLHSEGKTQATRNTFQTGHILYTYMKNEFAGFSNAFIVPLHRICPTVLKILFRIRILQPLRQMIFCKKHIKIIPRIHSMKITFNHDLALKSKTE